MKLCLIEPLSTLLNILMTD